MNRTKDFGGESVGVDEADLVRLAMRWEVYTVWIMLALIERNLYIHERLSAFLARVANRTRLEENAGDS